MCCSCDDNALTELAANVGIEKYPAAVRPPVLSLSTPPATERLEKEATAVASREHARVEEELAGAEVVVVEVELVVPVPGAEEAVAVVVAQGWSLCCGAS